MTGLQQYRMLEIVMNAVWVLFIIIAMVVVYGLGYESWESLFGNIAVGGLVGIAAVRLLSAYHFHKQ